MVYLSVGCGELCLQIRLSFRWFGVMFAIGFVSLLVGGLCLVLGLSVCWWLCDNIISFNSGDGVSVRVFLLQI